MLRSCRRIPSPSTASIRRPASSPIRRPPARSRCSINRASVRPRFSTRPMSRNRTTRDRPVTFVFNGGPGAGSAFLNLGLVGPRLAAFGNGYDGANVRLVDNPDTWLAFTDLVLIDPVGTGWSRPAKPDGGSAFWSVHRDAESMAKVIALYVAKNGRVSSPKFILGESYGGFRAAKVARTLQNNQGIVVSGILMVSPMLEGQFQFGGDHFALGAALEVAVAGGGRARTQRHLQPRGAGAGRAFRADRLSLRARRRAAQRRRGACVLRARRADDRIAGGRRRARARLHPRLPTSRICTPATTRSSAITTRRSRSTTPIRNRKSARGPDPFLDGFIRAYGSAFVAYARDELGFKTDMTYNLLASEISGKWDWEDGGGHAPPSATEDLRELLALTPVIPADDRARLQRHGHALRGFPLRARPHSGERRRRARRASALPRRPYVLYRSAIAQSLHRGCTDDVCRAAVKRSRREFYSPR